MPLNTSDRHIQHLLLRAGFGVDPTGFSSYTRLSFPKAVDRIFQDSKSARPIQLFEWSPRKDERLKNASPTRRKEIRKQRRQDIKKLNTHWLLQLATAKSQLREKMTLFWHDHFAARVEHPYALQNFNNLMREHALGDFKVLLMAVSKHPVMLEFLNNRQNKKASPNENFAREVMELFTLGRGNYTEQDIKEAARAFTGWNFDKEGNFIFRKKQHDEGPKEFKGRTGRFKGEDIIEILLEEKQTARYIAGKLYNFFVHPTPNAERTEAIASVFYDSGYDISQTLRFIFEADWFRDPTNIGVRIKSPAEYIAGMFRSLNITVENPETLIQIQKILGQVLFNPPNVAGWPDGRAWIDSSTLMARMTIPSAILLAADTDLQANADLMDMGDNRKTLKKLKKIKANVDWGPLMAHLRKTKATKQAQALADLLLQVPTQNLSVVEGMTAHLQGPERTKALTSHIISLPEYQLA